MTCGIYIILNTVNDKVYIGSSVSIEHRFNVHKSLLRRCAHSNVRLQNAWNKHGESAFLFEIIESCEPVIVRDLEQECLDILFKEDRDGHYNISKTADGISSEAAIANNKIRWSNPENKVQASIKQKEVWSDKELKKRHSGVVLESRKKIDYETWRHNSIQAHNTEEYKEGAVGRAKRQWNDPEVRAKMMASLTSEESRNKKSIAAKAALSKPEVKAKHRDGVLRSMTEERLQRMSDVATKMWSNPENRRRHSLNSPTRREIVCNETGKIYASISEAAKDIGACIKSIKKATQPGRTCKGKTFTLKTAE